MSNIHEVSPDNPDKLSLFRNVMLVIVLALMAVAIGLRMFVGDISPSAAQLIAVPFTIAILIWGVTGHPDDVPYHAEPELDLR